MKTFFKIILMLVFLTQSLSAIELELSQVEQEWLKEHKDIKFGADAFWPPFDFLDDNGKHQGFHADLMALINKRLSSNITIITGDWYKLQEDLKNKKIDGLMGPPKTSIREKYTIFTKPYIEIPTVLITQKDKEEIIDLNAFNGLSLAIAKGNSNVKYIEEKFPNIKIKLSSTDEDALFAISSGAVDGAIMSLSSASFNIGKNLINNLKVAYSFVTPHSDIRLGIRDDFPILRDILQKSLNSISRAEWTDITKKWAFLEESVKNLKKDRFDLTNEEREYLAKNSPLNIQALKAFPPFNFYEDGKLKGYSVDYMKLIAEHLDVDIKFTKAKAFGETISMFKEGKIDILPHIAKNKKREEFIDYTNFNHIEYLLGVTLRKDNDIKSIEDFEDRVVAVVKKTFIHSFMKKNYPNQELLILPSTSDAVQAVSLGNADIFIGSIPTMNFYIQKNWLSNVKTTKIDDLGLSTKIKMPMGVQEGNTILKSILEKVNSNISHTEIVKLKQKWLDIKAKDNNFYLSVNEKKYLAKKDSIKMCVLPNWLPFEQINDNGKHIGVGADIISMISEKIDKPFELVPTKEWSESLQNIRDRKCDILPVAMDVPSRRDAMNFTKAYTKEPFVIATKEDAIFIKDSSEIGNRKIGIVKSYAFIEVLKRKNPGIQIVSVKNAKDGLERVRSGELFGYVDIVSAIIYTMQQNSFVDLKISGKLEFDIKLSIASRNDEPILNIILQKSLNSITNKEIKEIVNKWLTIKVEQGVDYTILWKISIIFIIILILVLYKNREFHILNKKLIETSSSLHDKQAMIDKYVMLLKTDLEGNIISVNKAYCDTMGYLEEELIGAPQNIVRHPDMSEEFFKELWDTITKNETWIGDIKNLTKNKKTVYFDVVIEPVFKNGVKVAYRSISKDITDRKRVEELSITDKLTKLYNRLKIDELLSHQINLFQRYKTNFSIILLDLDNFKNINDTYGHDRGDYVLKKISRVLKKNVRVTDDVGRWGGEEFIIICPNIDKKGAKILSENIRKSISKKKLDEVGSITVSLGVTSFNNSDNIKSLFKRVDTALYTAKENGKNKTVVL